MYLLLDDVTEEDQARHCMVHDVDQKTAKAPQLQRVRHTNLCNLVGL